MSEKWSPYTKRSVVAIALGLSALMLWRFRSVLPPLIIAMLVAYVLSPVVDFTSRRLRLGRTLTALLVYLCMIAALVIALSVFIPDLIAQIRAIDVDFQRLYTTAETWLDYTIVLGAWSFNVQNLVQEVGGELRNILSPLVGSTLTLVVDVASGVLQGVLIMVVSFYLIKDMPLINTFFDHLPPVATRGDFRRLRQDIGAVWDAFFRGQLILCLVIGTIVTIVASLAGLRSALVLGLIAGGLEFIPNVGPVVATVPAVMMALWYGSSWLPLSNIGFAALVIGLYTLIQQVENNYLVPRILGDQLNLHPLVVLVGVLAGANLGGILGIFLAAPVLSTLNVLLRYAYRKVQDLEPFPPSTPKPPPPTLWSRAKRLALYIYHGIVSRQQRADQPTASSPANEATNNTNLPE